MPEFVINSMGLGATAVPSSTLGAVLSPDLNNVGWANACGDNPLSYATNLSCWGYSYSDWTAAWNKFNTLTIPAPAPLGAPSAALTDPSSLLGDTTGQTSQSISNDQIAQSQASIAAANPSPGSAASVGLCPFYCSFLDCDADCSLSLDSSNLLWLLGGAALLALGLKLL